MTLEPDRVRVCPLCGSTKIVVHPPDAEQAGIGATDVLHCECGANITLYVQPSKSESPKEKA